MKAIKILGVCFLILSPTWLLCGCSAGRVSSSGTNPRDVIGSDGPSKDSSGTMRVFTNANFVMWVPSRVAHLWDGYTSVVDIDETTFPGAFVKDYKIEVEVQVLDQPRQFQQMDRWSKTDWFYKDFTTLSQCETGYGVQIRKDVWNPQRTRRFLINAMVTKSRTFEADVKTAKKMVESVKVRQEKQ